MKKIAVTILVVFSLIGLAVPLIGCGSGQDTAQAQGSQTITPQRGDLTVEITAAGNLSLSRSEDLAFEIAGTVEEVRVEEGDSVEEGQLLAKLDTSEWEKQVKTLERQLTTAQRQLETAERGVMAKELSLRQAQIALQTAEYNLTTIEEVKDAQDDVDDAEFKLKVAQTMWEQAVKFSAGEAEINFYLAQINQAKTELTAAQKELNEVLTDNGVKLSTDVVIEVASKLLQIEQAQRQVEDAQIAIEDAQMDVEDAKSDVEDAQKTLDEAKSVSPEIIAPFSGFVTQVNVEGGDEVLKGTVAVQLADPNKFEAEITVSETDIFQIKLGGDATVEVDAIPGISLPAKVTHISPTATIQSGVVNYKVQVEIESLESEVQGQRAASNVSENFQLKEGLTVIVNVIVEESDDVLMVPNSAITTQGGRTFVKVVSQDGKVEEREIQTGISDYQYTEVTQGLNDGEQILVSKTTSTSTTSSTTTPTQQQPSGIMIPGVSGGGGPPPGGQP